MFLNFQVGKDVKNFKVGDKVGVGCMVESCLDCSSCNQKDEVFCESGHTHTYSNPTKHGLIKTDTGFTYGGYSSKISVHHRFVVKVTNQAVVQISQKCTSMFYIIDSRFIFPGECWSYLLCWDYHVHPTENLGSKKWRQEGWICWTWRSRPNGPETSKGNGK